MYARANCKRLLTHAAAAAFLLHFGYGPAAAGSLPGSFSGADNSSFCMTADGKCPIMMGDPDLPVVKAKVDWKVGLLVGEPVVDTRLAWTPGSVRGLVPPIYGKADPDLFYKSGEAAAQLRLYEAKARLTVHHGNRTYTIESDLGVPDKAGDKSSYNVAGSPSWNRLFRDESGAFIPAGLAKEIISSGSMERAEAKLVSAKMDTGKFEEWWLDKNVERYAAPLRAAIDGRLEALEESFGLPTDDLRAEIAALKGGKNARTLIGRLEGILQKLAPDRIPAKFLGEGPEKLARLHRYGLRISSTEDALRDATKGLPPMPGASKAYGTWYDQVAVRMNRDAARLAHLQGLKAEAERAEREAAEAERRVQERQTAERERRAAETERQRRRKATEPQKSFSEEFGDPDDDISWGNSGFADTGWGATMNRYVRPGSGTYYSQTQGTYVTPGTDRVCDAERNATDAERADANTEAARSADAALHKCLYGN
jgi:hypothetical protein